MLKGHVESLVELQALHRDQGTPCDVWTCMLSLGLHDLYLLRWRQTIALSFGTTMVYVEVLTVQSTIIHLVLSHASRV